MKLEKWDRGKETGFMTPFSVLLWTLDSDI